MSRTNSEATLQKKISILFILPDLEAGGAERIITTLANHLTRHRFQPKILLLRKTGPYLDFLKDDVEIIEIKRTRIRQALLPILRVIRQRKPDIVFSGFGEVNAFLAPFIPFFPKVKFIARETNVVSQHVTRPEIRFFYRFYSNYHRIICQSDDMQKDLAENFKIQNEKLVKINNPVDFDFIDEKLLGEPKPEAYLPEFKNVVAVGNLSARKGFDRLLHVFSHLKNEKILLHILGNGRDRELLLQMKSELGLDHVIFHGQQSNPYPYLKFADLFILSSRYEGFPNVLLEAGACGTYSLANDCLGGIREIINPQINGELGNIENSREFARLISETLEKTHPEAQIRSSIYQRFHKDLILRQYENVLKNL